MKRREMRFQSFEFVYLSVVAGTGCLTLALGCTQRHSSADRADAKTSSAVSGAQTAATSPGALSLNTPTGDEHSHATGMHGGTIVPIGADSFHAEVVVEPDGTLRMLMLGRDETRVQEVEIQQLKSYVKAPGTAAQTIDLVAAPDDEDTEGRTSQFTGQLPKSLIGKPLEVTIPSLKIQGERFGVGFTTGTYARDAFKAHMPTSGKARPD